MITRNKGESTALLTFVLLSVATILGLLATAYHQQLNTEITRLQAESEANHPALTIMPNPALNETLALAHETESSLNIQWVKTLNALEQAQLENRNIALTRMSPNKFKQEVLLLGQANDFDVITHYIKSLESNPLLTDVTLLKQSTNAESH